MSVRVTKVYFQVFYKLKSAAGSELGAVVYGRPLFFIPLTQPGLSSVPSLVLNINIGLEIHHRRADSVTCVAGAIF